MLACTPPASQDTAPVIPINEKDRSPAQVAIDAALETHGGEAYSQSAISFTFRKSMYRSTRRGGVFGFERWYRDKNDSTIYMHDILNNEGFTHYEEGEVKQLDDKTEFSRIETVNSVIYFASLPYGLNDDAVNKEYLGEVEIKGQPYHKVKVWFDQEGGGVDFKDVFIYWIHTENHTMDYLAYLYYTNVGGIRFREAINPRTIEGIRFQDYINYKMDKELDLESIDQRFEAGELEKLSEIRLEEVAVELLDK